MNNRFLDVFEKNKSLKTSVTVTTAIYCAIYQCVGVTDW